MFKNFLKLKELFLTKVKPQYILLIVLSLVLSFFDKESNEVSFDGVDLREAITVGVIFIFSMMLHEIAHGYVAYKFGDDTAKREGRLTLNPLKHLDFLGLLTPVLLILAGSRYAIGWAKPVPVNFYRLRPYKFGFFCVVIAGVSVNFSIAIVSFMLIKFIFQSNVISYDFIGQILFWTYLINLLQGIFNLIPITPADGGRVVYILGNDVIKKIYNKIEKFGFPLILLFLYIMYKTGYAEKIIYFFASLVGVRLI